MKPVFAFVISAACLVPPATAFANPPVGATAPLSTSADDKAFCIRTKGEIGRPGACLFASYQECTTSGAAIFAECYRNPRVANGQMTNTRNRDSR